MTIIAETHVGGVLEFPVRDEIEGMYQLRLLCGRNTISTARLIDEGETIAEIQTQWRTQ